MKEQGMRERERKKEREEERERKRERKRERETEIERKRERERKRRQKTTVDELLLTSQHTYTQANKHTCPVLTMLWTQKRKAVIPNHCATWSGVEGNQS